ncbi:cytochrome P450 CYP736A12-like protein [Tupanvirus soda lake]|uniref:Cytochrome P450 CYP736A12-like protein n=2 Tax=Tupanvirus TaxID=2094720 RepID=A0A6N1NWM1_9VIRU|nr:cytochrome P450 CYP736A12-like protein [Tupanvirus soda lake]QKU35688.1 cytochrome P450 CYP736A12-like protein [Tupanvirus soda lake]
MYGPPVENFYLLEKLAAKIVFGIDEEPVDNNHNNLTEQKNNLSLVDKLSLYLIQAQSTASSLGSENVPFPELREWYRNFLQDSVKNPLPNSLAFHMKELALLSNSDYTFSEIEDHLPFAFFQISGIFKVFLPIALAIACLNNKVSHMLSYVDTDTFLNTDNYLHYYVMEILRLYNTVFVLQREVREDIVIDDFSMKKGDQINLMFGFYMRDPNIYPNPDKFYPERWKEELNMKWNEGQHPFSSGSRTCPARNLALALCKFSFYYLWKNYSYTLKSDLLLDFDNMPQIINPYQIIFQIDKT